MGCTIPEKDYVIVFDASSDTLYDTLLFFHYDLLEARATGAAGDDAFVSRAIAVAAPSLGDDCTFARYFRMEDDRMIETLDERPRRPRCVHFLHFRPETEIALHRRLSRQCSHCRIPMANPYTQGTACCDSKYRMYQALTARKIDTPDAVLFSRFRSAGERSDSRSDVFDAPQGFYLQPDRGTEGQGCSFFLPSQREEALGLLRDSRCDMIARPRRGTARYLGRNLVCRINVCFDGRRYAAESGYAMQGNDVVCAANRATKENINTVLAAVDPGGAVAEALTGVCHAACRTLFQGAEPTLACGVDAVIETDDVSSRAYVIDVNPRPVVVGSRVIGSDTIGLGHAFWRGVRSRITSAQGARSGGRGG